MSSPIEADQPLANFGQSEKDPVTISVLERNPSDAESLQVISNPVNSGVEPDIADGDAQHPTNVNPVIIDAADVKSQPVLDENDTPKDAAEKTEVVDNPPEDTTEKAEVVDLPDQSPAEDSAAIDADALDSNSLEQEAKPEPEPETLIKLPRYVDFEGFKNVYKKDDKRHVLDVLLTGSNYVYEVRRLNAIRRYLKQYETAEERKRYIASISSGPTSKKEHTWISRVRIQSPGVIFHLANVVGETWTTTIPRTFARPFKVLIYFQPRMKETLAKLKTRLEHKKESDSDADKAKASDHIVSTSGIEPLLREGTAVLQVDDEEDNFETDAAQNPEMYTEETLGAIQCYVDFVDEKIMPLYNEFDGTARTKIRFDDLWLLFRLGELIYASPSSDVRPDRRYETTLSQSSLFWKIYTLNNPSIKGYPSFDPSKHRRKPRGQQDEDDEDEMDETSSPMKAFRVWAYYIDHDGASYGPVKHCFKIAPFEGEMDIAALPCYPARYVDDQDLLKTMQQEGAKFRDCIKKRHLSYDGWTASSMPKGDPIALDEYGRKTKNPEYIESHVIVDFAETFQAYPFWKPDFHDAKPYSDAGWNYESDDYGIYDIDTDHQSSEYVQVGDGVNMWLRKDFLEHDKFFKDYKAHVAPAKPGKEKKGIELRDEDLVLLPRRIFAYILRDRKFSVLDVRFLDFIQPQQEVFSQLKIPRQYKDIVKGLVSSHFVRKRLEREFSNLSTAEKYDVLQSTGSLPSPDLPRIPGEGEGHGIGTAEIAGAATHGLTQDVIQGKGRGLVILLHGVPGVGKTATAEAVALENRKPLFVITCGDLGLAPTDVETHLTEVFRLAHLWDCVLLLDEADVFLAARNNFDLNRNALVSVFLRVLEYYSGILFLTTNRVGTLDEAFKSRIHISLYYPSLRQKQAVEIFKVNITRLKKIAVTRSLIAKEPQLMIDEGNIESFAESLFDKSKTQADRKWTPWNGRQIRNAFQIASALAYNEMHTEHAKLLLRKERGEIEHAECPTPILNAKHFKIVDKVTDEFDGYMYEARGRSDASRAHVFGERADELPATHDLGLSEIGYTRLSDSVATGTQGYTARLPPRTPEGYRPQGLRESQAYSGPAPQRHGTDEALREPARGSAQQYGSHHYYERDRRTSVVDEEYRSKAYPPDSPPDYHERGPHAPRARGLEPDSTRYAREERPVGDPYVNDSVGSLRRDRSPQKFMRDSVLSVNQDQRYNNRSYPAPASDARGLPRGQHFDQYASPSPSPHPNAGGPSLFDDDNLDEF